LFSVWGEKEELIFVSLIYTIECLAIRIIVLLLISINDVPEWSFESLEAVIERTGSLIVKLENNEFSIAIYPVSDRIPTYLVLSPPSVLGRSRF